MVRLAAAPSGTCGSVIVVPGAVCGEVANGVIPNLGGGGCGRSVTSDGESHVGLVCRQGGGGAVDVESGCARVDVWVVGGDVVVGEHSSPAVGSLSVCDCDEVGECRFGVGCERSACRLAGSMMVVWSQVNERSATLPASDTNSTVTCPAASSSATTVPRLFRSAGFTVWPTAT